MLLGIVLVKTYSATVKILILIMSGRRVPVNITVDRKKPANNYALNRLTHKLQALKTKFICTLLIKLKV